MVNVVLNSEQSKFIFELLDSELRKGGLNSIQKVVDLYNVLLAAVTKENESELEKNPESVV